MKIRTRTATRPLLDALFRKDVFIMEKQFPTHSTIIKRHIAYTLNFNIVQFLILTLTFHYLGSIYLNFIPWALFLMINFYLVIYVIKNRT